MLICALSSIPMIRSKYATQSRDHLIRYDGLLVTGWKCSKYQFKKCQRRQDEFLQTLLVTSEYLDCDGSTLNTLQGTCLLQNCPKSKTFCDLLVTCVGTFGGVYCSDVSCNPCCGRTSHCYIHDFQSVCAFIPVHLHVRVRHQSTSAAYMYSYLSSLSVRQTTNKRQITNTPEVRYS